MDTDIAENTERRTQKTEDGGQMAEWFDFAHHKGQRAEDRRSTSHKTQVTRHKKRTQNVEHRRQKTAGRPCNGLLSRNFQAV